MSVLEISFNRRITCSVAGLNRGDGDITLPGATGDMMTDIQSLPEEMMHEVSSYLAPKEVVKFFMMVNRDFRQVILAH